MNDLDRTSYHGYSQDQREMEFLRLQVMEQQNIIDDLTKVQRSPLVALHHNDSNTSVCTATDTHRYNPRENKQQESVSCLSYVSCPVITSQLYV